MTLTLRPLTGQAVDDALDDLAQLRIMVFRAWPYLYDGDLDYERRYMASYRDSADAILVGAYDGDTLVGAATGTPMADHADDFTEAFASTNYPLEQVFYCAESVLLPAYRGQGAGHGFFDAREAHARALGFNYCAFCSVMRADDHPMRPDGYRPLDAFWRKRGYAPLPGVIATFEWKDVDEAGQSQKRLQFWIKAL
ncbi:GNAT family N-acetyltransferase [Actibacterium lipolyticum]|uniref:Acetyltransferase (GNAT) family protein n=1 Tax=Actibacterium lipolyticum TaxID=1524263 RepID=A0A238JP82_9RHOB|nr:GNAT family N-acetyltransferase [Actibacterium lipolyticum]SMX32253.1 Acetyltransferase (GNAT) family protein [Actibacterium lipolyticum]